MKSFHSFHRIFESQTINLVFEKYPVTATVHAFHAQLTLIHWEFFECGDN